MVPELGNTSLCSWKDTKGKAFYPPWWPSLTRFITLGTYGKTRFIEKLIMHKRIECCNAELVFREALFSTYLQNIDSTLCKMYLFTDEIKIPLLLYLLHWFAVLCDALC